MTRSKRGGGADALYSDHLKGTPLEGAYRSNPAMNRVATMERMYYRILAELCMNRFKWSGLPPEVDVRWLEYVLFTRALSVFFFDPEYDKYFALQAASNGFLNMMNNPTSYTVTGNGQFGSKTIGTVKGKNAKGKDKLVGVPIWANYMRLPDTDIVAIYANRLANLDRTVEINSLNARQNKFIKVPPNMRLSAVNINRMIDEGENAIQIDSSSPLNDMEFMEVMDLGVDPNTIEKMHIVRTRMWNEVMGLLGIENANQDKKERLVSAEVGANDDQTETMRYVNLNARRQACEDINAMFDLNVSVDYFTDADEGEGGDSEDDEGDSLTVINNDSEDDTPSKPKPKDKKDEAA